MAETTSKAFFYTVFRRGYNRSGSSLYELSLVRTAKLLFQQGKTMAEHLEHDVDARGAAYVILALDLAPFVKPSSREKLEYIRGRAILDDYLESLNLSGSCFESDPHYPRPITFIKIAFSLPPTSAPMCNSRMSFSAFGTDGISGFA